MNIYVLYEKSGIHSGRALGSKLISYLGPGGLNKAKVKKGRLARLEMLHKAGQRFDYIVNVGWYRPFDTKGAVVLNAPENVAFSSNKRKTRIRFSEENVPSPKLWLSPYDIDSFPVIGRTTHHSKGKGLWICRDSSQAKKASAAGATHFLKLISDTREFRVHVFSPDYESSDLSWEDYLVLKTSEKLNKNPTTSSVIKNHENGWYFGYPGQRDDPALHAAREAAKKALHSVGLHWGAVDVMISKKTGEAYVLEINSSPCLTDEQSNTLDKYADIVSYLVGAKVLEKTPKKKEIVRKKKIIKNVLNRHKSSIKKYYG